MLESTVTDFRMLLVVIRVEWRRVVIRVEWRRVVIRVEWRRVVIRVEWRRVVIRVEWRRLNGPSHNTLGEYSDIPDVWWSPNHYEGLDSSQLGVAGAPGGH